MENQNPVSENLPKLLILRPPHIINLFEDQFSDKFQLLKPWESPIPADQFLAAHCASVEAMLISGLTPITADVLRRLPLLRLICTTSAGLNHIDLPECRRRGVSIANAGSAYSEDVADLAVGLLIDVLRRVSAADRFLGGKRVGIIGLGSIGFLVAKRLEAIGCSISYNSRKKKPSVPFPFYDNVCDLATNCDVLVLCCALTDQTRHMINKEVLLALGKEGVIINIARGTVIDEKELVRCLVEGEIAGAGLDVFENEPQVPQELFALDNVVMSPHRAVFTEESLWDLCQLMLGNLEAFFSNKPLLSPVVDE
ncbi:hypothetical protein RHGRI_019178 [Rhododendron griersonianum]|uniref:Uncharacterized protein n=1 Tax=Rhododendron griersonianum TaxID=479676 RepID=A0AAV6JEE8_9ERIC|nr:hypothetical protein RHGRI_019178 [Rhododendron griersonianum]KAG5538509.1 hypothetical protein RHGRI_019178 [Rhododendron griersonianum]KAG5538510.1 hypothetical protein RHGRI_019178 [Rhododendron griersonianum]